MHIDLIFKYTLKAVTHSSIIQVSLSFPSSWKAVGRHGIKRNLKHHKSSLKIIMIIKQFIGKF